MIQLLQHKDYKKIRPFLSRLLTIRLLSILNVKKKPLLSALKQIPSTIPEKIKKNRINQLLQKYINFTSNTIKNKTSSYNFTKAFKWVLQLTIKKPIPLSKKDINKFLNKSHYSKYIKETEKDKKNKFYSKLTSFYLLSYTFSKKEDDQKTEFIRDVFDFVQNNPNEFDKNKWNIFFSRIKSHLNSNVKANKKLFFFGKRTTQEKEPSLIAQLLLFVKKTKSKKIFSQLIVARVLSLTKLPKKTLILALKNILAAIPKNTGRRSVDKLLRKYTKTILYNLSKKASPKSTKKALFLLVHTQKILSKKSIISALNKYRNLKHMKELESDKKNGFHSRLASLYLLSYVFSIKEAEKKKKFINDALKFFKENKKKFKKHGGGEFLLKIFSNLNLNAELKKYAQNQLKLTSKKGSGPQEGTRKVLSLSSKKSPPSPKVSKKKTTKKKLNTITPLKRALKNIEESKNKNKEISSSDIDTLISSLPSKTAPVANEKILTQTKITNALEGVLLTKSQLKKLVKNAIKVIENKNTLIFSNLIKIIAKHKDLDRDQMYTLFTSFLNNLKPLVKDKTLKKTELLDDMIFTLNSIHSSGILSESDFVSNIIDILKYNNETLSLLVMRSLYKNKDLKNHIDQIKNDETRGFYSKLASLDLLSYALSNSSNKIKKQFIDDALKFFKNNKAKFTKKKWKNFPSTVFLHLKLNETLQKDTDKKLKHIFLASSASKESKTPKHGSLFHYSQKEKTAFKMAVFNATRIMLALSPLRNYSNNQQKKKTINKTLAFFKKNTTKLNNKKWTDFLSRIFLNLKLNNPLKKYTVEKLKSILNKGSESQKNIAKKVLSLLTKKESRTQLTRSIHNNSKKKKKRLSDSEITDIIKSLPQKNTMNDQDMIFTNLKNATLNNSHKSQLLKIAINKKSKSFFSRLAAIRLLSHTTLESEKLFHALSKILSNIPPSKNLLWRFAQQVLFYISFKRNITTSPEIKALLSLLKSNHIYILKGVISILRKNKNLHQYTEELKAAQQGGLYSKLASLYLLPYAFSKNNANIKKTFINNTLNFLKKNASMLNKDGRKGFPSEVFSPLMLNGKLKKYVKKKLVKILNESPEPQKIAKAVAWKTWGFKRIPIKQYKDLIYLSQKERELHFFLLNTLGKEKNTQKAKNLAITSFAFMNNKGSILKLFKLLSSKNPEVQSAAIKSLEKIAFTLDHQTDKTWIPSEKLLEKLKKRSAPEIVRLLSKLPNLTFKELLELLKDKNTTLRTNILFTLGLMVPRLNKKQRKKLISKLTNPNLFQKKEHLIINLQILWKLLKTDSGHQKKIWSYFKTHAHTNSNKNPKVKLVALNYLKLGGDLKTQNYYKHIPSLKKAITELQSKEKTDRFLAWNELKRLGPLSIWPLISEFERSQDSSSRIKILRALTSLIPLGSTQDQSHLLWKVVNQVIKKNTSAKELKSIYLALNGIDNEYLKDLSPMGMNKPFFKKTFKFLKHNSPLSAAVYSFLKRAKETGLVFPKNIDQKLKIIEKNKNIAQLIKQNRNWILPTPPPLISYAESFKQFQEINPFSPKFNLKDDISKIHSLPSSLSALFRNLPITKWNPKVIKSSLGDIVENFKQKKEKKKFVAYLSKKLKSVLEKEKMKKFKNKKLAYALIELFLKKNIKIDDTILSKLIALLKTKNTAEPSALILTKIGSEKGFSERTKEKLKSLFEKKAAFSQKIYGLHVLASDKNLSKKDKTYALKKWFQNSHKLSLYKTKWWYYLSRILHSLKEKGIPKKAKKKLLSELLALSKNGAPLQKQAAKEALVLLNYPLKKKKINPIKSPAAKTASLSVKKSPPKGKKPSKKAKSKPSSTNLSRCFKNQGCSYTVKEAHLLSYSINGDAQPLSFDQSPNQMDVYCGERNGKPYSISYIYGTAQVQLKMCCRTTGALKKACSAFLSKTSSCANMTVETDVFCSKKAYQEGASKHSLIPCLNESEYQKTQNNLLQTLGSKGVRLKIKTVVPAK